MKSYKEIIQQLIEVNDKLISGEIDLNTAKQVCSNVQVLVNAAKLQLEVLKYQKKQNSEFFAEIEPIEKTINEIEENQKKPYKIS